MSALYSASSRGRRRRQSMLFSGGAFLHFRAKAMTSWQARATVCESGRQVARYALRVPYAGVIAGRSVLQSCSSSPTGVISPPSGVRKQCGRTVAASRQVRPSRVFLCYHGKPVLVVCLCWRRYLCGRGNRWLVGRYPSDPSCNTDQGV